MDDLNGLRSIVHGLLALTKGRGANKIPADVRRRLHNGGEFCVKTSNKFHRAKVTEHGLKSRFVRGARGAK